MSAPQTARARARAELTKEIKTAARTQLAEFGAASLSLRAVARELGMASSAMYRYFPGRDDLLTALIIDAYAELADRTETAVTESAGSPFPVRWNALTHAVRTWARQNPHEYALIYGSPVPGYAAPQDTVAPAQRITFSMLSLLVDGVDRHDIDSDVPAVLPRGTAASNKAAFNRIRTETDIVVPFAVLQRGIAAWTQMFGHLSFELFGQFHTVVTDYDALFDAQMQAAAAYICADHSV